MSVPNRLERGFIYHVFNRGNNREELFQDPASYAYFMKLVERHILPVADIYCYCLLRNHFHLLIRMLSTSELSRVAHPALWQPRPSQHLSNCFNAFAKATNAARGRTGCLFERPFGRRLVMTRDYFKKLVLYIHMNPQSHGVSPRFDLWPHSSYGAYVSAADCYLKRATVEGLFGGRMDFVERHKLESRNSVGRSDDEKLTLSGSSGPGQSGSTGAK